MKTCFTIKKKKMDWTCLLSTYISTVVNHVHLVEVNIFRVVPKHSQHKVIHIRDRLVNVLKIAVQKILFTLKKKKNSINITPSKAAITKTPSTKIWASNSPAQQTKLE